LSNKLDSLIGWSCAFLSSILPDIFYYYLLRRVSLLRLGWSVLNEVSLSIAAAVLWSLSENIPALDSLFTF
jgi:hypothetical protein